MKQHITIEQYFELNQKQRKIIMDWGDLKGYEFWRMEPPVFTIGQMIEFLEENDDEDYFTISEWTNHAWRVSWVARNKPLVMNGPQEAEELCDALWEAVKNIIDNQ